MKIRPLVVMLIASALAACADPRGGASYVPPQGAGAPLVQQRPQGNCASLSGHLYVANPGNSDVTVYPPKSKALYNTIPVQGKPAALAFDCSGNLAVAVTPQLNGQKDAVNVYAPNAISPSLTISRGLNNPAAVAFDKSGHLYVANDAGCRNSTVSEYDSNGNLLKAITDKIDGPLALIFDSSGILYVGNSANNCSGGTASITAYEPGTLKYLRTYLTNGDSPQQAAFAFDKYGDLVVGNGGTVTVYNLKNKTEAFSLSIGGKVAIDRAGSLYVTQGSGFNVYKPVAPQGHFKFSYSVKDLASTSSLVNTSGLAFDHSGNLYVSCAYAFSPGVIVYKPGARRQFLTISNGISVPDTLAFGP